MTKQCLNVNVVGGGEEREFPQLLPELQSILSSLSTITSLKDGEMAVDQVAQLLGMSYVAWIPDIANPYFCPQVDLFARARGWPEELLQIWWGRNAALKMSFYVRCRFEHLPFLSSMDLQRNGHAARATFDEFKINKLLRDMGISVLLTIPVHLPKSQIGIIIMGGNRRHEDLRRLLPSIAGHLLGIGHYFMRIAQQGLMRPVSDTDERSKLTPREWDCLRTLAQGYREAEVAKLIGISKVTVRFHLDNVVQKFGCKTRTQAVALAAQLGLLGPIGT